MRFNLYVIELGSSAWRDVLFDHRDRDPRLPCLYVGSTVKSIEDRFEQHLVRSHLQARAVRKHGALRLRYDLSDGRYATSRERAWRMEANVAEALRRDGYGVAQN